MEINDDMAKLAVHLDITTIHDVSTPSPQDSDGTRGKFVDIIKGPSVNRSDMVIAHKALRDQMFRNTLMSTSDAVLLFDAGAGQVRFPEPIKRPTADCHLHRHKELENPRRTAIHSPCRISFPRGRTTSLHSLQYTMDSKNLLEAAPSILKSDSWYTVAPNW